MRSTAGVLLAALLASLTPAIAQEKAPDGVYRVEFAVRDSSGSAKAATRRYSMMIANNNAGVFKLGDRVPVATGSFQSGVGGVGVSPLVNTQYTYIDTGVNIDANLQELSSGLIRLHSSIDMSSIASHNPPAAGVPAPNPTVSQNRFVVNATLPAGKPTVIASIDDPASNHKIEIEATLTRVN
jgi:hypothetical protein